MHRIPILMLYFWNHYTRLLVSWFLLTHERVEKYIEKQAFGGRIRIVSRMWKSVSFIVLSFLIGWRCLKDKPKQKGGKNYESVGLSIIVVLFLAMAREPYAITVMFLLLLKKAVCFINKSSQANKILVRSSVNRSMGIYLY